MLAASILLGLLSFTGMVMHIVIAVVAAVFLIYVTLKTKDNWESPNTEIILRAFFGFAFISGVVLMFIPDTALLALFHKGFAAVFVIFLVLLEAKN